MENVDGDEYKIPKEFFRIRPLKDIQMMVDKGENLPDIVAQVASIRTSDKLSDTKFPPKSTFNLILTCTFESASTRFSSTWTTKSVNISAKGEDDLV